MRVACEDMGADPGPEDPPLGPCFQRVVCEDVGAELGPAPESAVQEAPPPKAHRYSTLHIETGTVLANQWESRYISAVMPFVIPRMVSGPDYDAKNRCREWGGALP